MSRLSSPMPHDDRIVPPREYREPGTLEPSNPPSWPIRIAYVLLALPLIHVAVAGGAYPVPLDFAVRFYVLIGIAVGAAVFILRRRPRNVAGWIGLIGWGGLSLGAVANALMN